jgi:hypothetical protein
MVQHQDESTARVNNSSLARIRTGRGSIDDSGLLITIVCVNGLPRLELPYVD